MKPLLSCLLAGLLATGPLYAGPPEGVAQIDVLPGWTTPQGTRMAAIRLTLAPGWKTYWRAPGDAGIPPAFSWQGSQNIAAAQFHWPVPQVFDQNGMRSIGYADQVVIPVELTPLQPGGALHMAGEVDLGVCQDVCVPLRLHFDAALPPDGGRDASIVAALVDRPLTAAEAQVGAVTCTTEPGSGGLWLTTTIAIPSLGGEEVVVFETDDPQVWVSEAATARSGGQLTATAELVHAAGGAITLDRSALRITVLGSERAADITGCVAG